MKILVFDTCLDKMYLALAEDENILTSKIITNKDNKYHSAFLISTIKSMLKENALSPKDLDAIGTNIGPGSFTGIRACTTVARVMAQQLDLPAVGISSLEILEKLNDTQKQTIVALDARKNCAYLNVNGEIKGAVQLEEVTNILNNGDYMLITDNKLQSRFGGLSYQMGNYNLGEILAKLVYEKLKSKHCDWHDVKPLYIQPPPMG
ncbi:tRNA (adenosine(37)-N6)-threonylcarbamoyltransferase complex dimerization subunit type 1 TsaB [bacterium]|nr:tRNA (adenosine(37)-N6)-threonylcarbamoyltransferase complex dimerization subunit type 1 TsaB [bacterium]